MLEEPLWPFLQGRKMNCEIPRAKKILRKAAKEKRVVDAFVTFTPGSFLKAYTQLERTYLFTSNNKAFASPSCSGYSIFGDCMDGQDSGVRLERYMADEKGGKDGWKIENCGIIKYQLLDGCHGIRVGGQAGPNHTRSKVVHGSSGGNILCLLHTALIHNGHQRLWSQVAVDTL